MRLEASRIVKADLEKVYAAYTDFEAMPNWSKRLNSVRVTKRDGVTVYLESEGITSKGTPRRRHGSLTLYPPSRVESETETRFTRTKRTVAFEADPDGGGTRVTATLDIAVKGFWAYLLKSRVRKEEAEASALEELRSFAEFVEAARS